VNVVVDTSVVVAGIFWRNEPRRCLAALARRECIVCVTEPIVDEYERVAREVKKKEKLRTDPTGSLEWLKRKAKHVEPTPLTRKTCRDPKDDMFLECALSASAKYIVSRDPDLLALEKPYGIEIVTPRKFLSILAEQR
jgi:putative PIN family toxin of toxin-antitoxin system